MDANSSVGMSISTSPVMSMNQDSTSHMNAFTSPFFKHIYPFNANPPNKCISPNSSEKSKSFIGSSRGANHTGLNVTSWWKNVLDTTVIRSPKKPPNNIPHISVDIPQYMNRRRDF